MDRSIAVVGSRGLDIPTRTLPRHRSEAVRKPFGISKAAKKVLGVKSLAVFLRVTYRQLGIMLEKYTGRVYSKSTVATWAMYENRGRLPHKYAMPRDVVDALHRMYRDYVYWATDGRYAASVRGSYHWNVKVTKVRK